MKYQYNVRDRQGKVQTGIVEADDRSLVIQSLLNQNYSVIALKEVVASGKDVSLDFGFSKVTTRELVVMTRQLSTMIAAGLSILRCFRILTEQTKNKKLKKALQEAREDMEGGMPLWQSLAKHPKIFSKVYVSMIRAGEMGGVLDVVLDRLGEHLERENEIASKVKSASVYPTVISVFAVIMVFFLITFVMPTFVGMFQSSGAQLPAPTRILMALSNVLRTSYMYIFGTIIVAVYFIKKFAATPAGEFFFDRLWIHLPIIGGTISRITVARFARTMGTMVRSGIPILQALEVVEDVVGNVVISGAIRKARNSISEGDSITGPLEETGVFEPMVTQMIAVGEETGALDEMLMRMADYFEKEVMYMVDAMMSVIEPVLIMLVAVLVGGIVTATLLPIFDMMKLVG